VISSLLDLPNGRKSPFIPCLRFGEIYGINRQIIKEHPTFSSVRRTNRLLRPRPNSRGTTALMNAIFLCSRTNDNNLNKRLGIEKDVDAWQSSIFASTISPL
jgi:hypothetical protein